MKDYYRILQITPSASPEEIKKAYRRLAKVHHPDVAREATGEVFIQDINEAYKTLSNPDKRQRYDWIRTHASATATDEAPQRRSYQRRYGYAPKRSINEQELVRPYLKYTYALCKIALVFSLLLVLDFLLPMQQESDRVTYIIKGYADGKLVQQHDQIMLETWSGRSVEISKEAAGYFEKHPALLLYNTPILGKTRFVAPVHKQENRVWVGSSIYGSFVFFPLILLICAFLGSLKVFSPGVTFSFGVASGIFFLLSLALLAV